MTPYNKILSLIENCDPGDAAALDEIDARVWGYLNGMELKTLDREANIYYFLMEGGETYCISLAPFDRPTRSRNRLKNMRPEGYEFLIQQKKNVFQAFFTNWAKETKTFGFRSLPTEELAELHAIIQAIEHERNTPPPTSTE